MMTKIPVYIIDTTLRDGEHVPGVAFDAGEKNTLARLLDKAGVDELKYSGDRISRRQYINYFPASAFCKVFGGYSYHKIIIKP